MSFFADHQKLHDENSSLQSQILCQETLVLVTAAEHPAVTQGTDLQVTKPLVFVKGCNYRSRLEQWLECWEWNIQRHLNLVHFRRFLAA
jgi:DNA-binding transcriptional LysR family regulator